MLLNKIFFEEFFERIFFFKLAKLQNINLILLVDLALPGTRISFERKKLGDHFVELNRFWTSTGDNANV